MEDEVTLEKPVEKPITHWHTAFIVLVLLAIITPIFILSGYGPNRSYKSDKSTISFKYPLVWSVRERTVRDELQLVVCNHAQDGLPTDAECGNGLELFTQPATTTKLDDLNTDTGTVKKFDDQMIGGKSFRAYDNGSMPNTANGHAMIYELIDGGHYYRITAQYASSPQTLSHGQEVVLDSLRF
jgi:hypothetical protein